MLELIAARRAKRLALIAAIRKQNRVNYRKWLRYRVKQAKLQKDWVPHERPMFWPHEIDEMEDMRLHVMAALQRFDSHHFRYYSRRSIVEQAISHVLTGSQPPARWMQQVQQSEELQASGGPDYLLTPPRSFVATLWPAAVEAAQARYDELTRRMNAAAQEEQASLVRRMNREQ